MVSGQLRILGREDPSFLQYHPLYISWQTAVDEISEQVSRDVSWHSEPLETKKKGTTTTLSFWKKKSIQVWSRTSLLNHLKEIRKVEIHPARCIVVWAVAQHRVMRGPARQKGTISSFFLFLLHQMWHIVRFPRWEERATTTKDSRELKKLMWKRFIIFLLRDLTGSNLFNASVIKSRDVLRKEIIIITSPSFRDHGFFKKKKLNPIFFHISQNWLNVLILTVFFLTVFNIFPYGSIYLIKKTEKPTYLPSLFNIQLLPFLNDELNTGVWITLDF